MKSGRIVAGVPGEQAQAGLGRPSGMAALSLCLCLLSPPALADAGLASSPRQSGGTLVPEQRSLRFDSADLTIEILPEAREIAGTARLRLAALAPVRTVVLDLDSALSAGAVRVNGAPLAPADWRQRDGRLFLTPRRAIAAGTAFEVTIAYRGKPHPAVKAPWDDGMVWSRTPDGRPWAATTAQLSGCDLYWPCIDYPTFEPAFIDLHLVVPKGLKAPSNGVLTGVDTLPDGRTRWNWHAKTPTLYTVAFNIGPYEAITDTYVSRFGNRIPMTYWFLPGEETKARQLFAEFVPTLDFYEAVIGPYPFGDQKMAVVETPYRGMEHQTITAYGFNYQKIPEGFDKLFHHEFGHEWFANQMTAADWDDFWLHEGFDAYMQPLYGQWREGDGRYIAMMLDYRRRIRNQHPMVTGVSRTSGQVYDPTVGPGTDIYVKGAWILHTLRGQIGDEAFFRAVRELVYARPDPRPGNFHPVFRTTPDFITIVNRVTARDYQWFFDAYLYQAQLPKLLSSREGDDLVLRWQLPGDRPFPLPVEVSVDSRVTRVAMTGNIGRVVAPPASHIVIDPASRILMQSDAIDAYQAWSDQHPADGR